MGTALLLGFSLENFRSFRDERSLKLTRSVRESDSRFPDPDVVPAIAIFGANASGKTNLLRGLATMATIIRTSAISEDTPLPYTPYVLGDLDGEPTRFEMSARVDGTRYDYGFSYTSEEIVTEWLYSWPSTRRRILYERNIEPESWYFGDSLSGPNQALSKATRRDALFLSTAKLLNHEILAEIHSKLVALVRSVSSEDLAPALQNTLKSLTTDAVRESQINLLMSRAEFGVVSLGIDEQRLPEHIIATTQKIYEILMPQASAEEIQAQVDAASVLPQLQHSGVRGNVAFPFGFESTGTRNFLALLGPVLDRLNSGGVLLVDEIDTSLHPRLVSELVRLFQDPDKNPRQAQLILSTHDVTVIMNTANYNVLERDQVWFVDKDKQGSSRLYPLLEFSPRKAEVLSRAYLMGRYGAVPVINDHAFWDLWPHNLAE